jgi:hypothetical protein
MSGFVRRLRNVIKTKHKKHDQRMIGKWPQIENDATIVHHKTNSHYTQDNYI